MIVNLGSDHINFVIYEILFNTTPSPKIRCPWYPIEPIDIVITLHYRLIPHTARWSLDNQSDRDVYPLVESLPDSIFIQILLLSRVHDITVQYLDSPSSKFRFKTFTWGRNNYTSCGISRENHRTSLLDVYSLIKFFTLHMSHYTYLISITVYN